MSFVANPASAATSSSRGGASFAPPTAVKRDRSAPLYKDKKTPFGSKNQKSRSRDRTGVSKKRERPDLHKLRPQDLKRLSSLEIIYREAVEAGWLQPSEANFRNLVAAAVRATRAKGDSVRIFVGIVRRGLWHHITHEQERWANEVISRNQNRRGAYTENVLDAISKQVNLSRIFGN
jgi:hypothetical protein